MSDDTFRRHLAALVAVGISLGIVEGLVYYQDWLLTLMIPMGVLSFAVYKWSGLRGAILAGLAIILYAVYHRDWYGLDGIIQVMIGVALIALPSGILKRAIREIAIQAEHYRLRAIDTFNGNRRKMEQALEALDLALKSEDLIEIKKYTQIGRIKVADTLTLVDSWHEIAHNQQVGIEKLEQVKRSRDA